MYSVYFPYILKYKVIMCYKILHITFYENSLNQRKENMDLLLQHFVPNVLKVTLRNGLIKQHCL